VEIIAGCISWSPGSYSEHYEFHSERNRFQLFLCLNYTQDVSSTYNKVAVLVCLHILFVKFLKFLMYFGTGHLLGIQTNLISVFRFS
jgi:hypothetical protein